MTKPLDLRKLSDGQLRLLESIVASIPQGYAVDVQRLADELVDVHDDRLVTLNVLPSPSRDVDAEIIAKVYELWVVKGQASNYEEAFEMARAEIGSAPRREASRFAGAIPPDHPPTALSARLSRLRSVSRGWGSEEDEDEAD